MSMVIEKIKIKNYNIHKEINPKMSTTTISLNPKVKTYSVKLLL